MSAPLKGNFQSFLTTLNSPALRVIASHWDKARGDRLMPTWADLSTPVLSPHFAMIWGFQYDPGSDDFVGRLAGKNVRDWLGANFWGASLRDLHAAPEFHDARHFLSKVVTIPAAGRCSGRLFTIGENAVRGKRIALPLAADGTNGDAVLGASDYQSPLEPGSVVLIHENMEWYAI
jgi:hypothetical protein